jgi:hypothetical protein
MTSNLYANLRNILTLSPRTNSHINVSTSVITFYNSRVIFYLIEILCKIKAVGIYLIYYANCSIIHPC